MIQKLKHTNDMIPQGVKFMVLSALGFAMMSACVKYVSQFGIPVLEIVAARALVSFVISYVDVKRKGIPMWGENKPLLLLRGGIGTLALMCVYYSVTTLPLAEATLLQYTHPVFTAILGLLFLKEKIHASTMVCIILCLIGLGLIMQPSLDPNTALPLFSILMALIGALGSSVAYVIVRKLSQSEDSSVIIMYFPLVALPISLFLVLSDFVWPNFNITILLLFCGFEATALSFHRIFELREWPDN